MKNFINLHKIPLLIFLSCCAFYLAFAYDLERTDFFKFLTLWGGLFFLSWKFFQMQRYNWKILLTAAIIFRLLFLIAAPNLSQDFFRFIWDGRLLLEGINPYLMTPAEYFSSGDLPFSGAQELYEGMGSLSAGNPTNYPPLNQLFFALASLLGGNSILGSIIWLRIFIIAADIGIFYFGRKLLRNLKLPENNIFLYLLNPLIIIELTGNLHFEGVMLFFLLAALYLLQCQKWLFSALFFSCSIAVKLIPLIFLPLLIRKLGWKKALGYYAATGIILLLIFLPFLSGVFAENFFSSINLWFQKFEFNASIYYLIRWIGYEVEGYNIIGYAGPALAGVVFVSILLMAILERNHKMRGLLTSIMFSMVIYLLLATTVHPWYLATPLLLSVFTRYKFMQVWSLMVVLSYFAYSQPDFEENLWFITVEYVVVFGVMFYEIFGHKNVKFPADLAD
ncbi:polyprenol phosphomannose-dependent alpha 1,6 mannosyltransferase MptB [Salinimicrobium sp. MT39]|uniref:Polyprenol phosphomannose-dependent alpha 1,6 mannosyltransferase MptB n=1 Tax=Salinimicrobium profundisediminis TaxID=2994553 RepID=A0A9X3I126_9FLAO|nr:polyprenol phosphomannose-dependent alpha 1,6 mannosyltransferase MptB [Salinimicrobium profundisediminis]MCX2838144.1 polyprenol phosphomannose-dependent alpha 1,6 mannosyltransferase MptB [Salinimicrobium profundisediminis]